MISKVLIFEDNKIDAKKLNSIFEKLGCTTLIISHSSPYKERNTITEFNPEIIVSDCRFDSDIDGINIVKQMNDLLPNTPIVICSILVNDVKKKDWIFNYYFGLPNVCKILPKNPFPSEIDFRNIFNSLV